MNIQSQRRWLMGGSSLLLGLLFITPLYAQTPSSSSNGKTMSNEQTNSDKPAKIEYHLAKLTPRCVGRVLMDVPEDFEAPKENESSYIDKVRISSKAKVRKEDFPYLLKQRIEEFNERDKRISKRKDPEDKLDLPFLKETEALHDGYGGVIYNRNEDASMDVSRTLEANIWRDGVAIRAELNASDGRAPRYDKERRKYPDVYRYDVPQKRQELLAVLKRLKGWDGVHVPHEPGSCYGHVYVTGPDNFAERTAEWWIYNKNKDLHFSLDVDNQIKERDTMLERIGHKEVSSDEELIRKRVVPLPQMPNAHAEEYLMTDYRGEHDFMMIINEKVGSSKTPYIMVQFNDRGLLSKEDALTLWDAMIPTIRMRPGAF